MSGRLDADLFDLLDARELRPRGDVVLKALDAFGRPLGVDFDATVGEVAHVADDLVARGDALREEAVAHALHVAADYVMPRDPHALFTLRPSRLPPTWDALS